MRETLSVFELPPEGYRNDWPFRGWRGYSTQHPNTSQRVTKWGAWQWEFRITWGTRTTWFKPWRYTSGPTGTGPGMYGSIERRDVWGITLGRCILWLIRASFAEETAE